MSKNVSVCQFIINCTPIEVIMLEKLPAIEEKIGISTEKMR